MRKTCFAVGMVLAIVLLIACTLDRTTPDQATNDNAANAALDLPDVAANEVQISRNLQTGLINPNLYGKLEGEEAVGLFREAYGTANKFEGELDVSSPNYDVVYQSDGKTQAFHLWLPNLGVGEGMLMEVADTRTAYILTAEATKSLKEIIGDIRYDSKQAAANGDIVHFLNKIENFDAWERFIRSVDEGTPDSVHYVAYTIEGDPLFTDLVFDGKKIQYTHDTTHDKFGLPETVFATCEKVTDEPLSAEFGGPGTLYRLDGCTDAAGAADKQFWFPVSEDDRK
ncbi:DUF4362 domain-containing protein [Saccharibacillus sacchari]|uniref:DUF4362 domain-containing protein n=1 Tax=Saccharibacillus sacchari TaxID=456493 RepID=A0ACC6PEI1_9BACL